MEHKLTFMSEKNKGFARTFAIIEAKYGNKPCTQTGEVWHYMGTVDNKVHQFRHRSLNGKRIPCVEIPVEPQDFEAA